MRKHLWIPIVFVLLLSGCGAANEVETATTGVEPSAKEQTAGEDDVEDSVEKAEEMTAESGAEKAGKAVAVQEEPAAEETEESAEDVPESYSVTLRAVGDDLIHSGFYNYAEAAGCDYSFMFENVKDVIEAADIAIINQETIFVNDRAQYSAYPLFGSPTGIGDAMIAAGFDVVQLATNHSLDKGLTGISDTVNYFADKDVLAIGIYMDEETAKEIPIMEKNGITFAFLNYTYGTNGLTAPYSYTVNLLSDEEKVRDDIRRARELAEIVVVLPHWGTEYSYQPNSFQKEWTAIFLEEGVDIVIGAHPHVVQPYEMLTREDGHQMLVYYSLGNFISYQDRKERMLGGMAEVTVTVTEGEVSYEYDLVPLVTYIRSGAGPTTYFLSDYDKEDHRYGATRENMEALFEKIMKGEAS